MRERERRAKKMRPKGFVEELRSHFSGNTNWLLEKLQMSLGVAEDLGVLRRFASDQLLTLAKLVIENAFQPIVEVGTGAVFGYESLMRGYDRIGFSSPLDLLDRAAETDQLL
eukprot:gene43463-58874_t